LYRKRGKRPMNMSGRRWYKASIGFWRPGRGGTCGHELLDL